MSELEYLLQMTMILGKVRQAFLIEESDIENHHVDILTEVLSNEAQKLKDFVTEYSDPEILSNLKYLHFMKYSKDGEGTKNTRILVYIREQPLPDHNLNDSSFIAPLLSYCGTYGQQMLEETSYYSIYHNDIELLTFIFLTGKEDYCINHGEHLLAAIQKLIPKLEFHSVVHRNITPKAVIFAFNLSFEELTALDDFQDIFEEAMNILYNTLFVEIDSDKVKATFTPKKQAMILAWCLHYLYVTDMCLKWRKEKQSQKRERESTIKQYLET
jgi:hypothetical protein